MSVIKENMLTSLPPDNPISSPDDDVLDWVPIAKTFTRYILSLDTKKGLVVGVFGSWGSGKTSFINLARPEFVQQNALVFEFNPWLFSGADQLVARFFSELSAVIGKTSNLENVSKYLKKYGDVLSPAILSISTLSGYELVGKFFLHIIDKYRNKVIPQDSADALRKKLTEALAKSKRPIIVVLDDVDRLPIDEIRELFKLVRLTASFPNLVYIVACDRIRVEAALKEDVPEIRGNYLEKIFQWSINIPVAPREQLRREFLGSLRTALGDIDPPFDQGDWPDIEAEIIQPLVQNIRDVRRYSMAVQGTVDNLSRTVALVDVLALEAIRLFIPDIFDKLPHLIEDLAVLPVWESNQRRSRDLLEQIGDIERIEEESRNRLEKLTEGLSVVHQKVVHALINRIFSGGRAQHEKEEPRWSSQQLRNNRVVHGSIFRLYLTRAADSDLAASNSAKRVFKYLHDPQALQNFLCSHDPQEWPKIILSLWGMFRNDFVEEHIEPGLIVFWNMLPDMPGRPSMFADESLKLIQTISGSLLETLAGTDRSFDLFKNVFRQLQSLSSGVALIQQIKRLKKKESSFLSDSDICTLKKLLNDRILSVKADELIRERHPAQVLLFSKQCADLSTTPYIIHDSPRLTFVLLWDCRTESSTGELGTRSIETEQSIHWETLISIHGDESMLKARIESLSENFHRIEPWIVSEVGIELADTLWLLQLAREKFLNVL